jgi:AcrR family transcriptional regulator
MAGTKDRILDSTAELFRRQGYTGTGVKQIAEEARAPFGSLYHFFPGGKEQLGEEVIRWSGGMYLQLFVTIAGEADGVAEAVEDFFRGAAETLEETDYADACPIATVALEVASTNEQLRRATADVFETWIAGAVALFSRGGIPEPRSRELALQMLCALEGGFLFSRAMRTTEPMHVAGAAVASAVREALATAG